MRINRNEYKGYLMLVGSTLIDRIARFPEQGMGYSLVDVTLNDDTLVEQVPISDGTVICFYDDMRKFSEADIKNVAPSQI